MSQTTSHLGICLIDNFELCRLAAYRDAAGIPTIGWGHTDQAGTFRFKMGARITQAKADAILHEDLEVFERAVNRFVEVSLAQYEFDALVSFAYNVGAGALERSTLLARLNAGDRRGAAAQFMAWTHSGGRVLGGLVTRRRCEARLFSGDIQGAIALAVAHGHVADHPDRPQSAVTPDAPPHLEAA